MKLPTAALVVLLAGACGDKKGEPAPADVEPAPARKDVEPAPAEQDEPAPAPVDPAAFVAIDLAAVPALAGVAAKGPPGATVIPDAPPFGEDAPLGAVISQGGFSLHLWWSTTGGERTTRPMQADLEGRGTYVETTSRPDLVEYTVEGAGKTTYGFFRPIDGFRKDALNDPHGQLLCGPAGEVASPEALAPYRAACDAVAKK